MPLTADKAQSHVGICGQRGTTKKVISLLRLKQEARYLHVEDKLKATIKIFNQKIFRLIQLQSRCSKKLKANLQCTYTMSFLRFKD